MLILRQLFKFVELLHTENSANQLCGGFVLGIFMGFTPPLTLHGILMYLVVFILRVNLAAVFLSMGVFVAISFALDPLLHSLGFFMLTVQGPFHPLWVWMYHAPVIPYTRFNNSIVMGSFLLSLVLSVPLFLLSRLLVRNYQTRVVERIRNTNFVRAIKATKLARLYVQYRQIGK